MFKTDNIYSLTDFQRNARTHLDRLKQLGLPEILTVNGQAEIVVQDAAAYQPRVDKLEAIEGIRKGLEAMKQVGMSRRFLANLSVNTRLISETLSNL
ncbi:prevent-host-death protein [Methylomonas paludis]|uniref:Prevent-host-death protein n=1 Tax=Methylomonas paludis TaxID=1173101 RepID=A0A975MQ45_9GAMM|nr:prevent-host-death protein [Methylomonas paludis]QWF71978.1 prevent-host-death protein [Methylomonas paludis]